MLMSFASFLKDEMRYQGLTTKELSDRSGVNKRTIDHYLMTNPQEPSVSNAYKIAKALNVSVEYLLTGKENAVLSKDAELVKSYNSLSRNQKELIQTLLLTMKNQNNLSVCN